MSCCNDCEGTPVGTLNLATWSYDVTMIYSLRAIIIDAFVNKFNFSKHDVTMTSGSQAAVRTCNDYSGSNVQSFCSRCGRHNTLLLLTVITKVLVECIIEPGVENLPLLTSKPVPFDLRGRLFSSNVRSSMLHGTETWPMTSTALHRLCRNDRAMIRWICGVKPSDDPCQARDMRPCHSGSGASA